MYLLTFHCILFAIHFFLPGVQPLRWLGLKKPASGKWNKTVCQSYYRSKILNQKQFELCKKRLSYMKYIAEAVELTISECLKQAKYELWDCKAILKYPKFSPDIREGTRESGFLHALSSAAVVFTVTRGCTKDNLKCYCGKKPEKRHLRVKTGSNKPWIWAKCHDNIAFGMKFSKDFLDTVSVNKYKEQPDRMLMNLHNNNAGRKAVRNSLKDRCRCHGFTGGCTYLTCTRQLPDGFSELAMNLFGRYKKARQVYLEEKKDGSSSRRLVPNPKKRNNRRKSRRSKDRKRKKIRPVDVREIVYLNKSRNFCHKNEKRKLPGTEGRECARKVSETESLDACSYLCCGRGEVTKKFPKIVDCRCKFVWLIMDVRCKKCTIKEDVSTCR